MIARRAVRYAAPVRRTRPLPAYQLRTARLLLRCWQPTDAPALTQAIAESISELRQWLPWAEREPETVEAKAERLRGFRAQFEDGKDALYGIFDARQTIVLGAVGLHDRIGAGAREIGYWIHTSYTRQGLASEAVAALTRMGFVQLNLRRIEIHCHPQNLGSAAIPMKLGFSHQVTIRNCVPSPKVGPRDTQIWTLEREAYRASACFKSPLQALDASGNELPLS